MDGIPGAGEETFAEKFKRKFAAEPLVPIGAFVTAGVLGAGFLSFKRGNQQLSQKMMRARVVAQLATITALGYGAYYSAENRTDFDDTTYKGNLVTDQDNKE
mmetsp:Transcript_14001/g.22886  ORF Transcript_14001/g.22886 Transcript_14001/m.22886 type:complete len:102 (-) Transcript_14001:33-338(-)